jgi:hypothetical protein
MITGMSLVDDLAPGPSGLEQLRAMMASGSKAGIAVTLTDAEGRLYASATSTLLVMDR